MIKGKNAGIGKIVTDDDLPARIKNAVQDGKRFAIKNTEQMWNETVNHVLKNYGDMTGDDLLSVMTTSIVIFTGCWIANCMRVANADDTGYTREEVLKTVLNGIIAGFGAEAEWDDKCEKPKDMHSIKPLNKKN